MGQDLEYALVDCPAVGLAAAVQKFTAEGWLLVSHASFLMLEGKVQPKPVLWFNVIFSRARVAA